MNQVIAAFSRQIRKKCKKIRKTQSTHILSTGLCLYIRAKRSIFLSMATGNASRLKPGPDWPGSGSHARSDQRAGTTARPAGRTRVREDSGTVQRTPGSTWQTSGSKRRITVGRKELRELVEVRTGASMRVDVTKRHKTIGGFDPQVGVS